MTSDIELNRRFALTVLRSNPSNRDQIHLDLSDYCNGRCAVGLLAEAFGVEVTNEADTHLKAYEIVNDKLYFDVDEIWRMNDRKYLSFAAIADELERLWSTAEFVAN